MEIRRLRDDECPQWLRLRERLWPDCPRSDLEREMGEILAERDRNAVFVAVASGGHLIGFVEAALRASAEECSTSPVGYIEGWYVEPEWRRSGLGRGLLAAAERWAADLGCTEVASDTEVHNQISQDAHRALGYEETTRLVYFRKRLSR